MPETLITNDPEAVRAFQRQHPRVIYKSISGVRSIVQTLAEEDLARLGARAPHRARGEAHVGEVQREARSSISSLGDSKTERPARGAPNGVAKAYRTAYPTQVTSESKLLA